MGCSGSKATSATAAAPKTLLASPAEKQSMHADGLSMFIDNIADGKCFRPSQDGTCLFVVDVLGGPFGLWNNRPHTEKVKAADFVVKARKIGAEGSEWISNDAVEMLKLLQSTGPFEVVVKRASSSSLQEPRQDLPPVPPTAASAIAPGVPGAFSAAPASAETQPCEVNSTIEEQLRPAALNSAPDSVRLEEACEDAAVADAKKGCGICGI